MRTIKAKHKAIYEPVADLATYRVVPTPSISMNQLDPFILLNHHGRQEYLPKNNGLPFGPHPHRGFETVTFILEGDLTHKDSTGPSSNIKAGGVQWMTAGSGLIHSEISSEEFKLKGGPLEILQLWINLPAKYKMTEPKYTGLQKEDIPTLSWDADKVTAHIISGDWENVKGPVHQLTDVSLCWIEFKEGGKHNFVIDPHKNIFCYVVKGAVKINGDEVHNHYLIEFNTDGTLVEMKAVTNAVILFGHATPFKEPIVSYGPFVMNTSEEIQQAYADYRDGKFGDKNSL
jgi:redox-sensitive bicupin YhaK (pirin superfamily)